MNQMEDDDDDNDKLFKEDKETSEAVALKFFLTLVLNVVNSALCQLYSCSCISPIRYIDFFV